MRAHAPWWRGRSRQSMRRWGRQLSLVLALVLAVAVPFAVALPAAARGAGPHANPELLRTATASPNQTFRVIVKGSGAHGRDAAGQAVAASRHAALGAVGDLGVVTQVQGKDLTALASAPNVDYVSIDAPVAPTATGASAVDGSQLGTIYPREMTGPPMWTSKWTGYGIGVAVVDTGITPTADFTDGHGHSRIVASKIFSANTTTSSDGYGHGTHVAGLIAGNSWYSSNTADRGKYVGMAPQANLIDVKVADDTGLAYESDIVNAIMWVIENRTTDNIRVLNLSFTSTVAESYTTSILDAAVEEAWFSGIFVVVSAGNSGPNTMLYAPANDPFVVTVGAADMMGTTGVSDDTLAPWTSYGITQDGYSKPDIVAPGRFLTSVLASASSVFGQDLQSRVTDPGYVWLSGTSMSAAIVSGIAADTFEHFPNWTNDQLKWVMTSTATVLGGKSPYAGQGAGEVNPANFWNYKSNPKYANSGLVISSDLSGPNGATTYTTSPSSSSWSSSSWSSSSWSSSSWSSSSWSSSSWRSSSWQSDIYLE